MTQASVSPDPRTADIVTRELLRLGIDTIFCLPGVQNDHLFDAFHRVRDKLRLIHTRHEQGAAYMALGAAMATGKPSVFCVVPGPGVLNTTAALATAYACNAPVLALTGQIPSSLIGKGFGILHEIPDQLQLLRGLTKWAARIESPEQAADVVQVAFAQMKGGRPRPAALECAIDVWPRRLSGPEIKVQTDVGQQCGKLDMSSIRAAARRLERARYPVIIVGSGAQDAGKQVTEIAEKLCAPVIAHRMGQGVIDSRHFLSANIVAGEEHWSRADVVLAVGTRLQFQQQVWGVDEQMDIIRIDIDPAEIARFAEPSISIQGDATAALDLILSELNLASEVDQSRREVITAITADSRAQIAHLEPQLSLLAAIRSELPDNGIFVDELTQLGYVSRLGFPVHRPRTYLSPGYQGTLGWAFAAALGAKVAQPNAAVVAVSGDGGFMFNIQELATAVQHKIPVAVIVVNDGAFGNVRRTQIEEFDGNVIASDLKNPDFCRLAESFGALSARVDSPQQLKMALRQAFAAQLPTVIEVPALEMPSPWKFLRSRRIRPHRSASVLA